MWVIGQFVRYLHLIFPSLGLFRMGVLKGWVDSILGCCCWLSYSFRSLLLAWDKPCSWVGVVEGRDLCHMRRWCGVVWCGWGSGSKRVCSHLVKGEWDVYLVTASSPALCGGAVSRIWTCGWLPPGKDCVWDMFSSGSCLCRLVEVKHAMLCCWCGGWLASHCLEGNSKDVF